MAQNNTIGCWHASGSPHDAASICLVVNDMVEILMDFVLAICMLFKV